MKKQFITLMDGKKIYTQIYDNGHKDTLVMLHGGPGAGCFNFQYQAEKLSEYINVVLFDQRGVLRSDKIEDNDSFGLHNLVDDCENLKNALGIKKWVIYGHSFGGQLALLYGTRYIESIKAVILECPSLHFISSMRSVHIKCIEVAEQQGNYEYSKELKKFLNENNNNVEALIDNNTKMSFEIRNKAYFNSEFPEKVENVNKIKDISDDQWNNGNIHFKRLRNEGKIYENIMPLISKLQCPSLLLSGKYDPVCCKEQQEFYLQNSIDGKSVMFDNSGHSPHNEEPDKFIKTVVEFLQEVK